MSKVSVILPAYQAEATLTGTLRSVLDQTHRDIEVLVVDDGSTDRTRPVAERFASIDRRVRVLTQPNFGVAASRNLAIEHSTGDYIAPIDADDLWHPRKLEWQLERFAGGGTRLGLVYNWFRVIDRDDRVRPPSTSPRVEGMCLNRHLAYNFIGNGSTPLIRRAALDSLRYNCDLARMSAGGCEDYLLQLQIAADWEFGLVHAWLTGYRKTGSTMSSNVDRMIRSHILALGMMSESLGPPSQMIIRKRIARLRIEHLRNRLYRGKIAEAAAALAEASRLDALRLPRSLAEEGVAALRELLAKPSGALFESYPPDLADGQWDYKLARLMDSLEPLDRERAATPVPAGKQILPA